jgi:hypothetical protein
MLAGIVLRDLQCGELRLRAVGSLGMAAAEFGQHRTVAGFHVLCQQGGQAGLLAAQSPQSEQPHDKQGGKQDEAEQKVDFEWAHGGTLPVSGMMIGRSAQPDMNQAARMAVKALIEFLSNSLGRLQKKPEEVSSSKCTA